MPAKPIKVAIVEDDSRLRESLSALIEGSEGFRCLGAFPDAETGLKLIPANWPDVVLMDINLPNMSGTECVSRLKAENPSLQIIMLTVYVDEEQIFNSLVSGASGYLIKKTSPARILEAITDVCSGGSPMSSNIARKLVQHFQGKPASETRNLTRREHEILSLLAKGYHYKEIAAQLSISMDTVRTHIHNLYEKLHVRSRTEAVIKYLGKTGN
mgnify:CR=1 FL=1